MPHAVDIDMDGNAELVFSSCVYSSTPPCSVKWCANPGFPPLEFVGTAVVNVDSDPMGEVLMTGTGRAALFEPNGTLIWNVVFYSTSISTGFPAAADFNGDGVPDFGIPYMGGFVVLSGVDGSTLKTQPVYDISIYSSASAFDFQNDGKFEFIRCGELDCFIISETWNLQVAANSSTATENAAIADIDLDGVADVVSVGDKVVVINADVPWASADSYWNQHAYNGANHDSQYNPIITSVSTIFRSTARSCLLC